LRPDDQGRDRRREKDGRPLHADAGQRYPQRQYAGRGQDLPDDPARHQCPVDLPPAERAGEHVIHVPVVAGLEQAGGAVDVTDVEHRLRGQAGQDELSIRNSRHAADPAAEREAEDDDEQQGRDDASSNRRCIPPDSSV
jgi:hypothetical protein